MPTLPEVKLKSLAVSTVPPVKEREGRADNLEVERARSGADGGGGKQREGAADALVDFGIELAAGPVQGGEIEVGTGRAGGACQQIDQAERKGAVGDRRRALVVERAAQAVEGSRADRGV